MLVILISKILIPHSFDFLLSNLHILWEGIESAIIMIKLVTRVLLSLIYQLHKNDNDMHCVIFCQHLTKCCALCYA